MTALYHFWSAPEAQRVRLALCYKRIPYQDHPLAYHDDATFFELGVARHVPVLQLDDGTRLLDSIAILTRIDALFPGTPPLVEDRISAEDWRALLDWRTRADAVLQRLYSAARPAYRDIGSDPDTLAAYKAEIQNRFGMSVEALANDRYDGYAQLDGLTRLAALARHLSVHRYYSGQISIADLLLTADLYPLQVLDGISPPIDLMYYFSRVEEACGVDLRAGWLATV